MSSEHVDDHKDRVEDGKPAQPEAGSVPPAPADVELSEDQLGKVSGGANAHEMKKSLIANFPR